MKIRNTIFFSIGLLSALASMASVAQVDVDSSLAGRRISGIWINGNEKTMAHVILREMKTKTRDALDPGRMDEDWKRILNLGLFNRVQISAAPTDSSAALFIDVTEPQYWAPVPILHLNEKSWKKISYGAGLIHINFRGRAETVFIQGKLGYNPLVQFSYSNPWIGPRKLTLQTDLYLGRVRSRHFDEENVDEIQKRFQVFIGKRFGFHTVFRVYAGYREVGFEDDRPATVSETGLDRIPYLGCILNWDHRDLRDYPHRGWNVAIAATRNGFSSSGPEFSQLSWDARVYLPLSSSTLAARMHAGLSSGAVPVYDKYYFGFSERIRGHFNEVLEGDNHIGAGLAWRIPLLPIRYFQLDEDSRLTNLRFGMGFGIFADTGAIWQRYHKPLKSDWLSGYGCGLHFLLPYNIVLRFETAFDENSRQEWVADLDVDI